jgi:glutaredoxin 3
LTQLGCSYREIDVTHDEALYRQMLERSGGRYTVPQIFVDGVGIGGYTELRALGQSGAFPPT